MFFPPSCFLDVALEGALQFPEVRARPNRKRNFCCRVQRRPSYTRRRVCLFPHVCLLSGLTDGLRTAGRSSRCPAFSASFLFPITLGRLVVNLESVLHAGSRSMDRRVTRTRVGGSRLSVTSSVFIDTRRRFGFGSLGCFCLFRPYKSINGPGGRAPFVCPSSCSLFVLEQVGQRGGIRAIVLHH